MGTGGYRVKDAQSMGEESGEEVFYMAPEQTEALSSIAVGGAMGSSRDMTDSLSTTVPLSMRTQDLQLRHTPSRSWRWRSSPNSSSHSDCCCGSDTHQGSCCGKNATVVLVVIQSLCGMLITALAVYMQLSTTVFKVRECPHWAGVPLFVAGVFGIYFCVSDMNTYSGSKKAYVVKCIMCLLSAASAVLCLTAAVFAGYSSYHFLSYTSCQPFPPSHCHCTQDHADDPLTQILVYTAESCDFTNLNITLLPTIQCGLNLIAGIVSFTHLVIMWNSRYGNFYSGLKFYSYAADTPPHPWFDRSNPPYATEIDTLSSQQPRLTVRQASQRLGPQVTQV